MLTNNFKYLMTFLVPSYSTTISNPISFKNLPYPLVNVQGRRIYLKEDTLLVSSSDAPYIIKNSTSLVLSIATSILDQTGGAVFIGSGTTPPTPNDYTIENQIIRTASDKIVATSPIRALTYDDVNNIFICKITYGITNNESFDLTITEVGFTNGGMTTNGYYYDTDEKIGTSGNTAYKKGIVLMDRTLLDSPLVIPSGETGTLNYEISLPIPTFAIPS